MACPLGPKGVEFVDCNPKPAQRDYPECYTYAIEPEAGAAPQDRCIPERVLLTLTGYPGIVVLAHARTSADGGAPTTIRLTLERLEGDLSARGIVPTKPGSLLGTIRVEDGAIREFRAAPGLAHHTTRNLPAFAR